VLSLNWVNKLYVFFTFFSFTFCAFYCFFCMMLEHKTEHMLSVRLTLEDLIEHLKTSVLEFQLVSEEAPCLF